MISKAERSNKKISRSLQKNFKLSNLQLQVWPGYLNIKGYSIALFYGKSGAKQSTDRAICTALALQPIKHFQRPPKMLYYGGVVIDITKRYGEPKMACCGQTTIDYRLTPLAFLLLFWLFCALNLLGALLLIPAIFWPPARRLLKTLAAFGYTSTAAPAISNSRLRCSLSAKIFGSSPQLAGFLFRNYGHIILYSLLLSFILLLAITR